MRSTAEEEVGVDRPGTVEWRRQVDTARRAVGAAMAVWRVWIGMVAIVTAGCSGESASDDDAAAAQSGDETVTIESADSTEAPATTPVPTTTPTTVTSTTTTSTTVAPTRSRPTLRSITPSSLWRCAIATPTAPGLSRSSTAVNYTTVRSSRCDIALTGVAPDEPNPDVWSGAASGQCATAFQEFTGGAIETSTFSIAAVLASPGAPPVIACAAVTADASQWAGTAEEIVGAYEGIDVGECFNFPTQDSDAEEIGCDEPHEAEMFLVKAPVGLDDPLAPYPTEAEWDEIDGAALRSTSPRTPASPSGAVPWATRFLSAAVGLAHTVRAHHELRRREV